MFEIELESRNNKEVPEGAKILEENNKFSIKKISNGFLIIKRTCIEYKFEDNFGTSFNEIIFYTKENPLDKNNEGGKFLAENFE